MIEFGNENRELNTAPFLVKAIEETDNNITFIVSLPMEGEKGTAIDDAENLGIKELLAKSMPIYPDDKNMYKIVFEHYVLHQTRNESYTSWDDYEVSKGKYFLLFEKSRLLDSVSQLVDVGIVDAYYPNGYKHYGIYCQNHVIDIIATREPMIEKLRMQ
ncbi:MAG: hypothetical protein IJ049_00695 [Oscillospiraceae bacterium]|nr:hypothetical protein [Oscillospiraceae bacterium]